MAKVIEFDPDANVLASKLEFDAENWYWSMTGKPEGEALPGNTEYGYTLYENTKNIMIENAYFTSVDDYKDFLSDVDSLRSNGVPFDLKININDSTAHVWDGDGNTKIKVLIKKIDKMGIVGGGVEKYVIQSIRLGVYGGTS